MAPSPSPSRSLSPDPSSPGAVDRDEARPLPCMKLLIQHYLQGGLDSIGYQTLHRMIQMISALGEEAHATCAGGMIHRAGVRIYCRCLLEGCEAFSRNMMSAVNRALDAKVSLPELEVDKEGLEGKLKQWRLTLRTLHKPTGNDTRLFESILDDFHAVSHPFLDPGAQTVRRPSKEWVAQATTVHDALEHLCHVAQEADQLVCALDKRFATAVRHFLDVENDTPPNNPTVNANDGHAFDGEELPAAVKKLQEPPRQKPSSSKSFGVVEDVRAHRSHVRSATFSEADYTTATADTVSSQQARTYPLLGFRRKGASVPRIFTGSFSQLESDIRRLHIDQVETPVSMNIDEESPVKVRDFGATPAMSTCTTPGSAAIEDVEAGASKDFTVSQQVASSDVRETRGPSSIARARTIDDAISGLDAWLKEEPGKKLPMGPESASTLRAAPRHRENTM